MSLAVHPDSNRQHLVLHSVVILQHNKAESSLQAAPGKRTANKTKRVGWVSAFQSKQSSFRPLRVSRVRMRPHMAVQLPASLPKALHNFRGLLFKYQIRLKNNFELAQDKVNFVGSFGFLPDFRVVRDTCFFSV